MSQPPTYRPSTLSGRPLSKKLEKAGTTGISPAQRPHFGQAKDLPILVWAFPASLAVTKGIIVIFFSSAY